MLKSTLFKAISVPFEQADAAAKNICALLNECCDRIDIAGSIRRKRRVIHDVDLIAIPRSTRSAPTTLFGDTVEVSLLAELITRMSQQGMVKIIKRGEKYQRLEFTNLQIPVDLYLASEATWSTLLLIRTGSKEHNIYLCSRARDLGMQLKADGSGLLKNGRPFANDSEESIFRALDLDFVPPEKRETDSTVQ